MTTDRDEILALYEGQARDEVEDLLSKVGVIQQSTYTYNQYATTGFDTALRRGHRRR